jgi:hypothetical protein
MEPSPGVSNPNTHAVDAQMAVHAASGTVQQVLLDLSTVRARLADADAGLTTAGVSGYKRLAEQLTALSGELAQAAGWLRDLAAGNE